MKTSKRNSGLTMVLNKNVPDCRTKGPSKNGCCCHSKGPNRNGSGRSTKGGLNRTASCSRMTAPGCNCRYCRSKEAYRSVFCCSKRASNRKAASCSRMTAPNRSGYGLGSLNFGKRPADRKIGLCEHSPSPRILMFAESIVFGRRSERKLHRLPLLSVRRHSRRNLSRRNQGARPIEPLRHDPCARLKHPANRSEPGFRSHGLSRKSRLYYRFQHYRFYHSN